MFRTDEITFVDASGIAPGDLFFTMRGAERVLCFCYETSGQKRFTILADGGFHDALLTINLHLITYKLPGLDLRTCVRIEPENAKPATNGDWGVGSLVFDGTDWHFLLRGADDVYVSLSGREKVITNLASAIVVSKWNISYPDDPAARRVAYEHKPSL